jgi:hypothetical protein
MVSSKMVVGVSGSRRCADVSSNGDEAGALRLVEGLGEGNLARSRRAATWSDLGPAFTKEVAQLPARLYRHLLPV